MGKRSSKDDGEIDILVDSWIAVSKHDDAIAWRAWRDWRRAQMGSLIEPDSFTVPTPFPPATVAAAKEYIAIVRQIRKAIGWNDARARLKTDVSAWMGN